MKKIYWIFLATAYLLAGCQAKSVHEDHDHEQHHEEEAGHDHEHEEHDHEHEHAEAGENHVAGEIVFKKANAEAIGLQTEEIQPAAFSEVLKTSGQIQAAQGLSLIHI
mgnify:FL=1